MPGSSGQKIGGIIAGALLSLPLMVANFFLVAVPFPFSVGTCTASHTAALIDAGLCLVTAAIAWLAIFKQRPLRNVSVGVRFGVMAAAAVLLIPWPCSLSGMAVYMWCAHPATAAR